MKFRFIIILFSLLFYSYGLPLLRLPVPGISLPPNIVIIFILAFALRAFKDNFTRDIGIITSIFSLFIIFVVISGIINTNEYTTISIIKYIFSLLVLIVTYVLSRKLDINLYTVGYSVAIASSFVVFIHVLNSYILLSSPYLSGSLFIITEHGKNQIATYMAVMCSLIFGLLITDKKDRVNRLIIICLFIHIAALIYTYSRSNTIAFLVSSLIMILSLKSISFRRKVIVLVASSTIFITGSIISYSLLSHDAQVSIMSSINSILTFSDQGDSTSISVRSKMILDGLILFFDSPVIGIGPGGFFSEVGIASHNTFIQIASEIGLLGLIFFILMIVLIIAISFKRESFALGALCCFVIIMFFQNLSDSMFFYTIAAFSMVSYQERRDEEIL